jgi:hypothetical protein
LNTALAGPAAAGSASHRCYHGGLPVRATHASLVALVVALSLTAASTSGATGYIDGISDQSLPTWDGSFAASPFASFFRARWARGGGGQITLARYVVQWNAMAQPGTGANPGGNYRERLEAWLEDARGMGLVPVLALTSYDHVVPGSAAGYGEQLRTLLDRAAALGYPVSYVEPWNEPNGQGHASAPAAAQLANVADGVCAQRACSVIAGDFEDRSGVTDYIHAYEQALTFRPAIWGLHPYVSVRAHSDVNLLRAISALRSRAAGAEVWFTEVGALYCSHGEVRGEARQASDASYLAGLLRDPAVAPQHAFYYGFLFGGRAQAPCAAASGDDSELYAAQDQPRAAAGVILAPPPPGQTAVPATTESRPAPTATSLMIEPFPSSIGGP